MIKATIPDVEIFEGGVHHKGTPKECTITDADLEAMVANWRTLVNGPTIKWTPYLKIGQGDPHTSTPIVYEEGHPIAGVPTNLRKVGNTLRADFIDMPLQVADWIDQKLYRHVSAEIDRPAPGVKHPQFGTEGAVLRAISILGTDVPACKGLAPLPRPVYFDSPPTGITITVFSERSKAMTRAEAIAYLTSKGVSAANLPEALPDALVISLATDHQTRLSTPAPAPGVSDLTKQFSEVVNPMLDQVRSLTATVNELQTKVAATGDMTAKQAMDARRTFVHNFCEQMAQGKNARLSPADMECDKDGNPLPHTTLARLMRADHVRRITFSEGGKEVQKTDLELQMEEIRKRAPMHFTERMRQAGGSDKAKTPEEEARESATKYAERRNKQIRQSA